MTDQEINIAIAEACGWKFNWPTEGPSAANKLEHTNRCSWQRSEGWRLERIPNYCHDLNAMHEAERVLTECADDNYANFQNYLYHLEMIVCNALGKDCTDDDGWSGFIAFATARQRAEAFLHVKGLWKEEA